MRLLAFILLLTIGIGDVGTKSAAMQTEKLDGKWVPVKQEFGGMVLPSAAFEKQSLIISDSTYTFTAESVDKGVSKYGGGKMDIYGKEGVNTGKHFMAIYKLENDQLTICYNLKGDAYPETFDTKGKPMYFMSAFKRTK